MNCQGDQHYLDQIEQEGRIEGAWRIHGIHQRCQHQRHYPEEQELVADPGCEQSGVGDIVVVNDNALAGGVDP